MPGPITLVHKPTVKHGLPYSTGGIAELVDWLTGRFPGQFEFSESLTHLVIDTFEGDSRDCVIDAGYWVIEGSHGEPYPVQAFVVDEEYDRVLPQTLDLPGDVFQVSGQMPPGYFSQPAGDDVEHQVRFDGPGGITALCTCGHRQGIGGHRTLADLTRWEREHTGRAA